MNLRQHLGSQSKLTSACACNARLALATAAQAAVQRRVNGYIQMRNEQNTLWAAQSVKRGVTYAKAGQSAEAIASYNHAIELDRTHAGETQNPVYEWTMSARLCRSPPPHTQTKQPNKTTHTSRTTHWLSVQGTPNRCAAEFHSGR